MTFSTILINYNLKINSYFLLVYDKYIEESNNYKYVETHKIDIV